MHGSAFREDKQFVNYNTHRGITTTSPRRERRTAHKNLVSNEQNRKESDVCNYIQQRVGDFQVPYENLKKTLTVLYIYENVVYLILRSCSTSLPLAFRYSLIGHQYLFHGFFLMLYISIFTIVHQKNHNTFVIWYLQYYVCMSSSDLWLETSHLARFMALIEV